MNLHPLAHTHKQEEEEKEGSTRRWCEEVEGWVRREVGEHSTQLHRLTTALQELQLKLVGQIQQETTQVSKKHAWLSMKTQKTKLFIPTAVSCHSGLEK